MKNNTKICIDKNVLNKVFTTLLFSWGNDTPPEAVWTANTIMSGILEVSEEHLPIQLDEEFEEDNYHLFISQLNNFKER